MLNVLAFVCLRLLLLDIGVSLFGAYFWTFATGLSITHLPTEIGNMTGSLPEPKSAPAFFYGLLIRAHVVFGSVAPQNPNYT
jgi:hypothetical protein